MLRIDRQISGGNLNQFISKMSRTKGIPNHYLIKVKKFQNLDIIERVDDSTPLIVVAFKPKMTDEFEMMHLVDTCLSDKVNEQDKPQFTI